MELPPIQQQNSEDAGAKRSLVGRLRTCRRGSTAVEFGLIAAPFFLLVLGIMTVGLHYFTLSALEHAVLTAGRKLRTGEAVRANLTIKDFRELVCDASGGLVPCNEKFVVHIKSGATFADLSPPVSCLTADSLTPGAGKATDTVATQSGGSSDTVLVTACYDWELGQGLWNSLWSLMSVTPTSGQKTIISATTTFRSEPY